MKQKIKENMWEKFFIYPSFSTRFTLTLSVIIVIISIIVTVLLSLTNLFPSLQDKLALLNLTVQVSTFVLGIFAAYYALRQLVETRYTGLDQAGMQELQRKNYSRAILNWKEASYIRPEAAVFLNLFETLLLIGDFEQFDDYMKRFETPLLIEKNIFAEMSDDVTLMFLKAIRHLMVKNQGEAERYISSIVEVVSKETNFILSWNFRDLRGAKLFQDLGGECRVMAENLISYLSYQLPQGIKNKFESGNFSVNEPEVVAGVSETN